MPTVAFSPNKIDVFIQTLIGCFIYYSDLISFFPLFFCSFEFFFHFIFFSPWSQMIFFPFYSYGVVIVYIYIFYNKTISFNETNTRQNTRVWLFLYFVCISIAFTVINLFHSLLFPKSFSRNLFERFVFCLSSFYKQ